MVLDFDVGESRYRIARTLRRNGNRRVLLEKQGESGSFQSLADQVRDTSEWRMLETA